jgi:hypothetical protein
LGQLLVTLIRENEWEQLGKSLGNGARLPTLAVGLVSFLTPEQLTKWDAEATKAKEFLSQKLAA